MTFGLASGGSKGWYMPVVGLEESFQIMNRFAEVGGSFIDTYASPNCSPPTTCRLLRLLFFSYSFSNFDV
jgi:aryl-alcohol dehydrogenase-like predicted oxidoreductase